MRSLRMPTPLLLIVLAACGDVQTGADRLMESPFQEWLAGKHVGLVTNQTGVNRDLVSTAELVARVPEAKLAAFFAPEHGLEGSYQAGQAVPSGPRVFSLYGETREPTDEMLEGLDVLVYDIQDVGARFYTYTSTLFGCMKAASRARIPLIVLDRPDPIGGSRLEGPLLPPELASFVGIPGLPIRYGMTPGELAQFLNREFDVGCDLRVVPVTGWSREMWLDEAGLIWVAPSPNMPTLETAAVYPGFCLIEGVTLSEGRGTTKPFELFGAPWLENRELAARLNRLNLPGVLFRPQSFTPAASKYQGQICQGIQVHVTDREAFQPLRTALRTLEEIKRLHPGQLEFRPEAFDRLSGNPALREALEAGRSAVEVLESAEKELESFRRKRQQALIYD